MRAQEITFLKLVQGEKQFQVPLYQRTYSWTGSQLDRLWEDVSELVEQQLEGNRPASHFLGSVVLAPGPLQAGGLQRWLVVDGQQRLTTLMLAFTALRDHVRQSGAEGADRNADRIHRQYLVNEWLEGGEHYRLLPTQADREAFAACVSGSPRAGGGDNIGSAYRFFLGVFAKGAGDNGGAWVPAVETALRDLLSIVEIAAEPGDNVYRIFESINNTGVGLSQSDLLRNYVFSNLPNRGERVYERLWLPMQQQLGPKRLELLVWLDLVIRGNSKAKQAETYRDQQQRLQPLEHDEEALEGEIAELARRAEVLLKILEPRREPHPALRAQLERLADWGGQTHYPVALYLLNLLEAHQTTADEVAKALGHVESFLVRRLLCQASTNGLNRLFMSLPNEMEKDHGPAEAVNRYLASRRRGWPTDQEVAEAIRSKPFYWAGRPNQRFYVLKRLEDSHGASEPVDFVRANLTVEHVLPQRPAQAWFELLAEEAGDDQTPQELHDLLVHTLGNLTLSADNARLSNHPFKRKQEILEGSALRMNQEIAAEHRWGKAEILQRAERIAKRAVELWPGPAGGQPATDEEWLGWGELRAALVAMPSGTWTTYGDVAELIGSHPVPVGDFLATKAGVHGAYRVLTADGKVSANFAWTGGEDRGDPRQLLEAEGIPFDERGRARRSHRLTAVDLAILLGRDVPENAEAKPRSVPETADRAAHFEALLKENQPDVADDVLQVLHRWQQLDPSCHLEYGAASETSCFLTLDKGGAAKPPTIWPLVLYPMAGTAEVVFQHLCIRAPFDDAVLRRDLLDRLNAISGVDLAEAKLELRPSFPLEVLAAHPDEISAVLEWFVHTVALHLAQGGV